MTAKSKTDMQRRRLMQTKHICITICISHITSTTVYARTENLVKTIWWAKPPHLSGSSSLGKLVVASLGFVSRLRRRRHVVSQIVAGFRFCRVLNYCFNITSPVGGLPYTFMFVRKTLLDNVSVREKIKHLSSSSFTNNHKEIKILFGHSLSCMSDSRSLSHAYTYMRG